ENIRYKRLNMLANQGKDSFLSEEEFYKLKKARSEAQVDELLEFADIIIDNNNTKEELFFRIDQLMKNWESSSF
ncbi:hypothetical protein VPJ08_18605, partial [Acinetobacter baumannii]